MTYKLIKKCISKNCDGWTFMETLVVMSIVMILTASVGFTSIGQIDKAKVVSAKSQINDLSIALDNFYLDMGFYPSQKDGLKYLWKNENNLYGKKWSGPYVSKDIPKDPWGNPYQYKSPGKDSQSYEIISFGKDGCMGGSGVNEDISSAY